MLGRVYPHGRTTGPGRILTRRTTRLHHPPRPQPRPTIPHATVGETPGIAILDMPQRKLLSIVELGDPIDSDFHGLFVPEAHHGH